MNKYFEKTVAPKTLNEYCSIVLRIAQGIGLDKDNNLLFVIERFDDVNKYFETLTLPTVQNTVYVNLFRSYISNKQQKMNMFMRM